MNEQIEITELWVKTIGDAVHIARHQAIRAANNDADFFYALSVPTFWDMPTPREKPRNLIVGNETSATEIMCGYAFEAAWLCEPSQDMINGIFPCISRELTIVRVMKPKAE